MQLKKYKYLKVGRYLQKKNAPHTMQHIIIIGYFFINTISRQRLSSGQTSLIVFIIIIIFFLPSCSLGEIFICLLRERERESNVLWLLILENFTNQKNIQQKYKHRIWKKKTIHTKGETEHMKYEQHTKCLFRTQQQPANTTHPKPMKTTTTTTGQHQSNYYNNVVITSQQFRRMPTWPKTHKESKTNNNNTSIHPKNNNDMTWMSWGKILENTTTNSHY